MLRFHEGKTRMDFPDPRDSKAAWLPVTSGLRCWRAEMPAEDVERFEAAAGDLLKELGYPLATDAKPGALEHAARMRESFASDAGSRGQRLPAGWEA